MTSLVSGLPLLKASFKAFGQWCIICIASIVVVTIKKKVGWKAKQQLPKKNQSVAILVISKISMIFSPNWRLFDEYFVINSGHQTNQSNANLMNNFVLPHPFYHTWVPCGFDFMCPPGMNFMCPPGMEEWYNGLDPCDSFEEWDCKLRELDEK